MYVFFFFLKIIISWEEYRNTVYKLFVPSVNIFKMKHSYYSLQLVDGYIISVNILTNVRQLYSPVLIGVP